MSLQDRGLEEKPTCWTADHAVGMYLGGRSPRYWVCGGYLRVIFAVYFASISDWMSCLRSVRPISKTRSVRTSQQVPKASRMQTV